MENYLHRDLLLWWQRGSKLYPKQLHLHSLASTLYCSPGLEVSRCTIHLHVCKIQHCLRHSMIQPHLLAFHAHVVVNEAIVCALCGLRIAYFLHRWLTRSVCHDGLESCYSYEWKGMCDTLKNGLHTPCRTRGTRKGQFAT